MPDPIWKLDNVSLLSGRTARLSEIGLSIQSGITAVLGASGAGKSSLLSLLAGFEKPVSGALDFSPQPGAGQLPLFWSPQDHGLWPKLTAREHLAAVRPDAPQIERSVDEWLTLLRLDAVADALQHRLSQGERSRLSLGRALVSEAACLVLDEPLAHVDPIHCRSYLDLIADHAKSVGGTIVFSTHDPASVLRIAEHAVCLSETRCVFSGPVNELYFNPPTEEAAWLLGPANWIAKEDGWLRAAIDGDPPVCVRPHELVVVDCPESAISSIELVDAQGTGDLHELTLQDGFGRAIVLLTTGRRLNLLPGSHFRFQFVPGNKWVSVIATGDGSRAATQIGPGAVNPGEQ